MSKIYLKIAAVLNILTALLHLIGGQMDLVIPLLSSGLNEQVKSEWLGAWHMVTILLFSTAFLLSMKAFGNTERRRNELVHAIGWIYILASLPSICSSIYFQLLTPQWILLLPIGILTLIGNRKASKELTSL